MKEKFILTFDLEFWYNSGFLKKYLSDGELFVADYVIESVEPILDLLDRYGHKATFFVLGRVAEKYPELIRKISDSGHEIGSHGYSHRPLDELNEKELEREVGATSDVLKRITGKDPAGFRAPNFSLCKKTGWAWKVIKKYFQYDSSVNPLSFARLPALATEIPPSLGGIYFRVLPLKLYLFLANLISKQNPPVLYFHPYELFEFSPKINAGPWYKRKIKYWGTKTAWKKFEKLMEKSEFVSYENFIDQSAD
jgi:hypothetical protein